MTSIFDFNGVEPTTESTSVPGMYELRQIEYNLVEPADISKSAYIELKLVNSAGSKYNKNLFVTPKTLKQLQYIHEVVTGKLLSKQFTSVKGVYDHFSTVFQAFNDGKLKAVYPDKKLAFIVGKEINGADSYTKVIPFNFIVKVVRNKEDEIFNDVELEKYTTHQKDTKPSSTSSVLPSAYKPVMPSATDEESDLPF